MVVPGNKTLLQVSEIASKHRLKMQVPASAFIGHADYMNSRDRLIYNDTISNIIVVKKEPLTIFNVKKFIDEHMRDTSGFGKNNDNRRRAADREKGLIPPKYIMKSMRKHDQGATIRVYYCKNQLITDMIEYWGKYDILVQRFVIQKTMQPCIYRFYRNERNVYKAECIISKKSIFSDHDTVASFHDLLEEAKGKAAGKSDKALVDKTVRAAGSVVQNKMDKLLEGIGLTNFMFTAP